MRHIFTAITAAGFAVLASLPAMAQDSRCGDLNTADMHGCLSKLIDTADARLNTTYQDLLARMDEALSYDSALAKEAEEVMRAGQRAWITTRDNDCRVSGMAFAGGSLEGIVHGRCLLDSTENRVAVLSGILENYAAN